MSAIIVAREALAADRAAIAARLAGIDRAIAVLDELLGDGVPATAAAPAATPAPAEPPPAAPPAPTARTKAPRRRPVPVPKRLASEPRRTPADLKEALVSTLDTFGRWMSCADLAAAIEAPAKATGTALYQLAGSNRIAKRPAPPAAGDQPRFEYASLALLGPRAVAGLAGRAQP
jgi:hypothetical protein